VRFVMAACLGIAGVLTGLLLGYALWGQHMADLARELAKTNEELVTTKGWLLDEIEWSDERHGQTSARLTIARAELVQVRGELARITERHEQVSAALTNARAELLHVRGELTRIAETRPRPDGVARRIGNDGNWSAAPNVNPQRGDAH
jgi:Asp-tRNA(Asn)/Glu-tRNA(Gln) amidotransferase C subunit